MPYPGFKHSSSEWKNWIYIFKEVYVLSFLFFFFKFQQLATGEQVNLKLLFFSSEWLAVRLQEHVFSQIERHEFKIHCCYHCQLYFVCFVQLCHNSCL